MTSRKALPLERRDISGESPAVTDDGKIRGLAIPFNSWTLIGSGPMSFRERVAPGAVSKTLREMDTVYLDNHDPAKPVSRKSAGTFVTNVTERGVEYLATPADTTYARDLVTNIRAGNILGNSFGFEPVKDKWELGDDGVEERTILEMKLPEISACTFPAYGDTDIGMRTAYETAMEYRDAMGTRAAKATYADVNTCGECGAADQYGAFCGACGSAMGQGDASASDYCTSCGAPLDDSTRASHVCEERADAKKPYGDVKYADPKNGKYPINNKEHAKAAWSYINMPKNAEKYPLNGVTLSSVKAKIKAALKEFGVTVSEKNSAELDIDLRGYTPETGFETRDDPGGDEIAAMRAAIAQLNDNDPEGARETLEACLETSDGLEPDDTGANNPKEGGGMAAHTTPAGASVDLARAAINEAYEAVREFPPTRASQNVLAILEPHLSTPDDEQRGEPKPDASTSEIKAETESGLVLQERWLSTQREYRSLSR